eukprot:10938232-Ditylum_brightwellii.AAC.1
MIRVTTVPGPVPKKILAENIYPNNGNAHHFDSDHSTTSVSYPEGSTNGNVNSENISTLGREPPHITREETPAVSIRDHPLPIQVIPQEEEDTVVALSDQSELIRWHHRLQHLVIYQDMNVSFGGPDAHETGAGWTTQVRH